MRRSNIVKSWTSKQWFVALAISCGLLGLVLKLSGMLGSSGEATAPAAPHGLSVAGRDASGPTGSHAEPAQVASAAGERGNEGGVRVGSSDVGTEAGGHSPGHLTPRALRRLARIRGKKGPRSLGGGATDSATTASGLTNSDITFTSGDGVQYATASQVEVGDIGKFTGPAGTLSFWLRPGWEAANQDDATLLQLGDGRIEVTKSVDSLTFEFTDDSGAGGSIGWAITDWKQGEWHQITATWNGTQYSLYVDGQLVTGVWHNGFVDLPSGTKLYIGSNSPVGRSVAPGTIGQVDLRNRPLTAGEVANQFLVSLGK